MGQKDELAPCQEYRGWADMEVVEYKYIGLLRNEIDPAW